MAALACGPRRSLAGTALTFGANAIDVILRVTRAETVRQTGLLHKQIGRRFVDVAHFVTLETHKVNVTSEGVGYGCALVQNFFVVNAVPTQQADDDVALRSNGRVYTIT